MRLLSGVVLLFSLVSSSSRALLDEIPACLNWMELKLPCSGSTWWHSELEKNTVFKYYAQPQILSGDGLRKKREESEEILHGGWGEENARGRRRWELTCALRDKDAATPTRVPRSMEGREVIGFTINPLSTPDGVDWRKLGRRADFISVWRRTNVVKEAISAIAKSSKSNPCNGKSNVRNGGGPNCSDFKATIEPQNFVRQVILVACEQRYLYKVLADATKDFEGVVLESHYEALQLDPAAVIDAVIAKMELRRRTTTRRLLTVKKLTEDISGLFDNFEELASSLRVLDERHAESTGCHLEKMLRVETPTLFVDCDPTLLCEAAFTKSLGFKMERPPFKPVH